MVAGDGGLREAGCQLMPESDPALFLTTTSGKNSYFWVLIFLKVTTFDQCRKERFNFVVNGQ
jgi:hypothetical protein